MINCSIIIKSISIFTYTIKYLFKKKCLENYNEPLGVLYQAAARRLGHTGLRDVLPSAARKLESYVRKPLHPIKTTQLANPSPTPPSNI
jgi:hypothetical protein